MQKVELLMLLRMHGIRDVGVLSAIEAINRGYFVPETYRDQAWENRALPIGHGQTISEPVVVACMTELLQINPHEEVLEIGTGCGYQTAILSFLAKSVYTVERYKPLKKQAEKRLAALGRKNIKFRHGCGYDGWKGKMFDAIMVTAACDDEPHELLSWLKPRGRLVAPIKNNNGQTLYVFLKHANGNVERHMVHDTYFVPMLRGVAV